MPQMELFSGQSGAMRVAGADVVVGDGGRVGVEVIGGAVVRPVVMEAGHPQVFRHLTAISGSCSHTATSAVIIAQRSAQRESSWHASPEPVLARAVVTGALVLSGATVDARAVGVALALVVDVCTWLCVVEVAAVVAAVTVADDGFVATAVVTVDVRTVGVALPLVVAVRAGLCVVEVVAVVSAAVTVADDGFVATAVATSSSVAVCVVVFATAAEVIAVDVGEVVAEDALDALVVGGVGVVAAVIVIVVVTVD